MKNKKGEERRLKKIEIQRKKENCKYTKQIKTNINKINKQNKS